MTTNFNVTVLGPNGKRTNLKVKLQSSIIQIIEDACIKQKINPEFYDLKHLKRILDSSSTIRYSNIPNNALLELVELSEPRKESIVTVHLAVESGHLSAEFSPNSSLWDILCHHKKMNNLKLPSVVSCLEPVIVFTMRRISGEELKTTTLKSLGLLHGKCMLRYNTQIISENGPYQANVSGPLITNKINDESSKSLDCDGVKQKPELSVRPKTVKEPVASNSVLITDIKKENNASQIDHMFKEQSENNQEIIPMEIDNQIVSKASFELEEPKKISEYDKCEPVEKNNVVPSIIEIGENDAILFNFDDAPSSLPNIEESDEFFKLTLDEVKKMHQEQLRQLHELQDAPMMTSGMRQLEQDSKLLMAMNRHPKTQIRICFPDRNVIQATFKPRTTIREIMDFIRPFLVKNDLDFYLYTSIPKKILNPEMTLVDANCIPKARLYFGCDNEELETYLNQETLQKKSSFEGAAKAIITQKIPKTESWSGIGFSEATSEAVCPPNKHKDSTQKPTSSTMEKKPKWFKLGNR